MEQPAAFEEINSVRLSRDSMQKWLSEPLFTEVIQGLFCRVVVRDKDTKKLYKIVRVQRIHHINLQDRTAVITVAHGATTKDFPLDFVSNGAFTPKEFSEYVEVVQKDGLPALTRADILKTITRIKDFVRQCKPTDAGVKRPADETVPPAKQARMDPEALQKQLQLLKSRLKQERSRASSMREKMDAVKQGTEESHAKLREQQKLMKKLTEQHNGVKKQEKEIESMRHELEKLQSELATEEARCAESAKLVTAERKAAKQRLEKIKEMEDVIAAQREIIDQQRAVVDGHQSLSRAREGIRQRLRDKNRQLSRRAAERAAELERLRNPPEREAAPAAAEEAADGA